MIEMDISEWKKELEENPDITSLIQNLNLTPQTEPFFWANLLILLQGQESPEKDIKQNSLFDFIQKYCDLTDEKIQKKYVSKLYQALKDDVNKNNWNTSLTILIQYFINQILNQEDNLNPILKINSDDPHSIFIITLKNADAGYNFPIESYLENHYVLPYWNIDDENYDEVRKHDEVTVILVNENKVQYTREKGNENDKWIRLLMPQYGRRVEIEDLDRNFWVIGQVISAISNYLFGEDSPLVNVLEGLLRETTELWENSFYLWLEAAIASQNKNSGMRIIEIPIQQRDNETGRQYDDIPILGKKDKNAKDAPDDGTYIITNSLINMFTWANSESGSSIKPLYWEEALTGQSFYEKIQEKIEYLVHQYYGQDLCVIPYIRLNNYKHNYYSGRFYPAIFYYDHAKQEWYTDKLYSIQPLINIESEGVLYPFGGDSDSQTTPQVYSRYPLIISLEDDYNHFSEKIYGFREEEGYLSYLFPFSDTSLVKREERIIYRGALRIFPDGTLERKNNSLHISNFSLQIKDACYPYINEVSDKEAYPALGTYKQSEIEKIYTYRTCYFDTRDADTGKEIKLYKWYFITKYTNGMKVLGNDYLNEDTWMLLVDKIREKSNLYIETDENNDGHSYDGKISIGNNKDQPREDKYKGYIQWEDLTEMVDLNNYLENGREVAQTNEDGKYESEFTIIQENYGKWGLYKNRRYLIVPRPSTTRQKKDLYVVNAHLMEVGGTDGIVMTLQPPEIDTPIEQSEIKNKEYSKTNSGLYLGECISWQKKTIKESRSENLFNDIAHVIKIGSYLPTYPLGTDPQYRMSLMQNSQLTLMRGNLSTGHYSDTGKTTFYENDWKNYDYSVDQTGKKISNRRYSCFGNIPPNTIPCGEVTEDYLAKQGLIAVKNFLQKSHLLGQPCFIVTAIGLTPWYSSSASADGESVYYWDVGGICHLYHYIPFIDDKTYRESENGYDKFDAISIGNESGSLGDTAGKIISCIKIDQLDTFYDSSDDVRDKMLQSSMTYVYSNIEGKWRQFQIINGSEEKCYKITTEDDEHIEPYVTYDVKFSDKFVGEINYYDNSRAGTNNPFQYQYQISHAPVETSEDGKELIQKKEGWIRVPTANKNVENVAKNKLKTGFIPLPQDASGKDISFMNISSGSSTSVFYGTTNKKTYT